ncbi:MAG: alpha/beta hydrolase [Bacteroidota bacterium]
MKSSSLALDQRVEYLQTDEGKSPLPTRANSTPSSIRLLRFAFNVLGPVFPRFAGNLVYRLFTTPQRRAKHKISDATLESARLFEFMYEGQILKGYEWGSGTQTCLLVHGWESRGTALRSFVPDLVEKGYRVVTFDAPAHGHSAGKQIDLPHFGGAIRAIIRHIGSVDTVIAHSFGGASLVYTMANMDNSIHLDRLVLIASPSRMEKMMENFARFLRIPRSVKRRFRQILENRVSRPLEEVGLSSTLPKINAKQILLVHDRYDKVVPFAEAETVLNNWESVSLVVTEGLGHFQLMKNPKLIKRVMQFIQQD